jgi:hypothetical protein
MPNIGQFNLRYCENGHVITSFERAFRDDRCAQCGTQYVDQCPSCNAPLDNRWESPMYVGGKPAQRPPRAPLFCPKCGDPFPWQLKAAAHDEASAGIDAIGSVTRICERFHLVVRQLRERHESRSTIDVSDEYDVQDLFHALLRLYFDDVRAEEATPSYAAKSGRIDFLIKDESIGIEVKKTRDGLAAKQVGEQLIEDIARYQVHPACKTLVCFVYDPEGRISNPGGLAKDLSQKRADFHVEVMIMPRGY